MLLCMLVCVLHIEFSVVNILYLMQDEIFSLNLAFLYGRSF